QRLQRDGTIKVIVDEDLPVEDPTSGCLVDLLPAPDSCNRRYYVGMKKVRHVFRYSAQSKSRADEAKLRVISKQWFEDGNADVVAVPRTPVKVRWGRSGPFSPVSA